MPNHRPHVLVVDRDKAECAKIEASLAMFNYEVDSVTSADKALMLAKKTPFDAIIISLDIDGGGFKLSMMLRELEGYADTPVAFTTDEQYDSAMLMEAQFYSGLFLNKKPLQEVELLAQLSSMVRIKQLQDRLKEQMAELDRLASTDPLTGLYNRRFFFQRLEEELARAARRITPLCLVFIDIDHFKPINDTYGHQAGDVILKQLATMMQRALRKSDIVGRVGGEEFIILLPDTGKSAGYDVAERLRRRVETALFAHEGVRIDVTISAGVYFTPDPVAVDLDFLVGQADAALYEAKEGGRNQVVFHSSEELSESKGE